MELKLLARDARVQYDEYVKNRGDLKGELLCFEGVDGYDVYNPSVPFWSDGKLVMAGRVQKRNSETSETMFFEEIDGRWTLISDAPVFTLEDPFVTMIGGEIVLGGVRLVWEDGKVKFWVTDFYRGSSIYNLKLFTSGPQHMKDIRLLCMGDGRVAVCSRPQGKKMKKEYGCIAKIGFTVLPSLDALTPDAIENAPFLDGHFMPHEWGGANQLHLLKNGLIGVIGHKSWGEWIDGEHVLHYYGISFALNPNTKEMSEVKVISSRDDFPGNDCREPRLYDVTFTSGIIRNGNGTADLYTGLSDSHVGKIVFPDPLLQYED